MNPLITLDMDSMVPLLFFFYKDDVGIWYAIKQRNETETLLALANDVI